MGQLQGSFPAVHFGKEAGFFGSIGFNKTSSISSSLHRCGHVGSSTPTQYLCNLSPSSLGLHDNIILLTNLLNLCAILFEHTYIKNIVLYMYVHTILSKFFLSSTHTSLALFKSHIIIQLDLHIFCPSPVSSINYCFTYSILNMRTWEQSPSSYPHHLLPLYPYFFSARLQNG